MTFCFERAIQELTKGWDKITSATEAYNTSLFECLKQEKTGCGMKARFAQFLLTLLGYEVEIIRGYYKSPERWTLHAWIKINGKEYDPTKKDFMITKNHSYTNPDPTLTDWGQVFKRIKKNNFKTLSIKNSKLWKTINTNSDFSSSIFFSFS